MVYKIARKETRGKWSEVIRNFERVESQQGAK